MADEIERAAEPDPKSGQEIAKSRSSLIGKSGTSETPQPDEPSEASATRRAAPYRGDQIKERRQISVSG
jgi:hypothetical protein